MGEFFVETSAAQPGEVKATMDASQKAFFESYRTKCDSEGEHISPVERGVWVLRKLLHEPAPPAPLRVPLLDRFMAELIDKLKAAKETEGSNLRTAHYLEHCPTRQPKPKPPALPSFLPSSFLQQGTHKLLALSGAKSGKSETAWGNRWALSI